MTQTIRGELRRAVYAHVQSNPGCTSADVATHFPEQATSVGGTLSHMHDDGLLSRQKKGAHFHYFIPEEQDALAKMHAQIAELQAWKATAIEKHPDLAKTDPLLLKAREIVAEVQRGKVQDPATITRLLAGEYDHGAAVQATLLALKSAQQ
jgi:hypothetical protein